MVSKIILFDIMCKIIQKVTKMMGGALTWYFLVFLLRLPVIFAMVVAKSSEIDPLSEASSESAESSDSSSSSPRSSNS